MIILQRKAYLNKMGTNYYIHYNTCDCCGRYDRFHIGKQSSGWQFIFHEIDNKKIKLSSFDPKHMLLNDDKYLTIKSFQDLKKFIKKYVVNFETAEIYDEYDEKISADDFFNIIKSSKNDKSHVEFLKENKDSYYEDDAYLDDEGYSFSKGDFS